MIQRGKKLRGNGIWEASRMMLPEHKEAIRSHRVALRARPRPELDEQRLEELAMKLSEAADSKELTAITVFGTFQDETNVGTIEKLDPIERYVKLVCNEETVWIPFGDIIHVEIRRGRGSRVQ